jgi:hypothetical protein
MPEQSEKRDLAYHIFSVLSFFFNCRDDGACRYRWENWLLEYFGDFLVALMMEKVCLYLLETHGDAQLFLEASFDLRVG